MMILSEWERLLCSTLKEGTFPLYTESSKYMKSKAITISCFCTVDIPKISHVGLTGVMGCLGAVANLLLIT